MSKIAKFCCDMTCKVRKFCILLYCVRKLPYHIWAENYSNFRMQGHMHKINSLILITIHIENVEEAEGLYFIFI
jgi:hypothetical protein